MKKLNYLAIISLIFGFLFITSCKKDEDEPKPDPINESEVAVKYLENEVNFPYGGFVVGATDVRNVQLANPNSQYLVDIRPAADFANGHIQGAVQVNFADLLTHIKGINVSSYDRIVVICFTGQTSAYAVSLLRAAGYPTAISLKWGMSSWNEQFAGPWLNNLSNARAAQFVKTPAPEKPAKGELPVIETGKTTGAEIVEARIEALFAAGYPPATITNTVLYGNLGGHQIINYWPNALYMNLGHIDGAYNYTPEPNPWKLDSDLLTLATDKPVVIYCFTGQTSSYLSAYLRILGYDSKSLMFGGNAMIWDVMNETNTANTFIAATEIKDYPFVTP